jgi:hypothetical protein
MQGHWTAVEKDLLAAPRKNGSFPRSNYKALRTAERVALLKDMTPEQKGELAAAVFDELVRAVTGGTLTGEMVDEELNTIGSFARENLIGGKGGWPLVRQGMLTTFGSLEAARDYYELSMRDTRFFGKRVIVSAELEAALQRAEAKYAQLGGDPASKPVEVIGGLAIRPNANAPAVLSDHSFGWAVDINAFNFTAKPGEGAGNPNVQEGGLAAQGIPDFWEFVREITGEDVFIRDDKGRRRDVSMPDAVDQRAEAERLSDLSDRLVAMFSGEAALMEAMVAYARSAGIDVPPGGGVVLYTTALAAASVPLPKPKEKDVNKPQRDANIGVIERHLAAWPLANGVMGPLHYAGIAQRLWQMGVMFLASGNAPGSGVEAPAATAAPSLGSLAAHGFMNLDPVLVEALTGGLRWLGGARRTKDFMHFELAESPTIMPRP